MSAPGHCDLPRVPTTDVAWYLLQMYIAMRAGALNVNHDIRNGLAQVADVWAYRKEYKDRHYGRLWYNVAMHCAALTAIR